MQFFSSFILVNILTNLYYNIHFRLDPHKMRRFKVYWNFFSYSERFFKNADKINHLFGLDRQFPTFFPNFARQNRYFMSKQKVIICQNLEKDLAEAILKEMEKILY